MFKSILKDQEQNFGGSQKAADNAIEWLDDQKKGSNKFKNDASILLKTESLRLKGNGFPVLSVYFAATTEAATTKIKIENKTSSIKYSKTTI